MLLLTIYATTYVDILSYHDFVNKNVTKRKKNINWP